MGSITLTDLYFKALGPKDHSWAMLSLRVLFLKLCLEDQGT